MHRSILKDCIGNPLEFTYAHIKKFSIKKSYNTYCNRNLFQVTILLTHIYINLHLNNINTPIDHLWVNVNENLIQQNIAINDIIAFTGVPVEYQKHKKQQVNSTTDITVNEIYNIKILKKSNNIKNNINEYIASKIFDTNIIVSDNLLTQHYKNTTIKNIKNMYKDITLLKECILNDANNHA